MSRLDRRTFLEFVGRHTAAAAVGGSLLGPLAGRVSARRASRPSTWVDADGTPIWTPVDYPAPTPGDGGSAAGDAVRFARYEVRDDLVLPEGFRYRVLAAWGDRLGPDDAPSEQIVFGFNCDFTGLSPVSDRPGEHWLLVNHEYISATPWLQGYERVRGAALPDTRVEGAQLRIGGAALPGSRVDLLAATPDVAPETRDDIRRICRAAMDDLGVSVLHVRQTESGAVEIVPGSPHHARIAGTHPETPTFSNCGGGTTPWGTFLTCEENFQEQVADDIDVAGEPLPGAQRPFAAVGAHPRVDRPFDFTGLGQGLDPPLDGRAFGWVCEVDPAAGRLEKLTALGRFRHENVALRVEPGRRLAAYMGDDRRGGHVWKWVSREAVRDPADPANRALLREGTLHVARWEGDFTGRWIPLAPDTPLRAPEPERMATGHVWLPERRASDAAAPGGRVAVGETSARLLSAIEWVHSVETFGGRPLAELRLRDLVRHDDPQRVILLDAFVMANAAGGTPLARPEAIQVHPHDRSVYLAFTDATGGGDGSPDTRIFPDSRGGNSRQYGAIHRLEEDGGDPEATTFKWGRFVSSGEVADGGGGFACADNLVFDPDGNLWMVCDISTTVHNYPVTREDDRTTAGATRFRGVFGNNALFMIPTSGRRAGVPHCFAIGPMECELTGLTFTPDGRALLLSVQHPGEMYGTRGGTPGLPLEETRTLTIAARDGTLFPQTRTVPLGSNFPSTEPGAPPRPCVVCITRG